MKIPFLVDPSTGAESVSLTLLVVSFVALLAAATLHMSQLTENTSALMETFMVTTGLYFGRRYSPKSGPVLDTSSPVKEP